MEPLANQVDVGVGADDVQAPKIVKLGSSSNPVYELHIYDFMEVLEPPAGFTLSKFDPQDYFVTSGDAIQKTTYMSRILWLYAGQARRELNKMESPTEEAKQFERRCWVQAGASNKLLGMLTKVRGSDIFLETEWFNHVVLCIPKNPRSKDKNKDQPACI